MDRDENKRVVVTGSSGFVGSNVARRLVADGWSVHAIVRRSNSSDKGVHEHYAPGRTLSELERIFDTIQPYTVLHMAAAGVQGGESVQTMLDANVTYTVNLVQAAAAVGCRNFIHTGSCFEYAANEGPLTEDSPIKPFSVYGGTKAASVALAQGLANEKEIRLIALRLFGVYGPGEAPGRLIPTVIHALSTREKAPMTHGRQIRDLSYIDDVVEAYVAVLRSFADDEDRSGLYNVCSGTPISVREIGERLVEIMQADPRLLMWGAKPSRGSEPLSIVGSDDKFRRCFGDYSRYDFSTGARRTVDIVNSFRSAA